MTLPTTCPLIFSGAMCAAYGTKICTDEAPIPINNALMIKIDMKGVVTIPSKAIAVMINRIEISRLLLTISANGTRNNNPKPYPN